MDNELHVFGVKNLKKVENRKEWSIMLKEAKNAVTPRLALLKP